MYATMKKLIERKYYQTLQEVVDRLNMFMMFNQITPDQYAELMVLAETIYHPAVEFPEELPEQLPEEPQE